MFNCSINFQTRPMVSIIQMGMKLLIVIMLLISVLSIKASRVSNKTTLHHKTVRVPFKTTCNIIVIPSNSIYTGGIATNIYLGYGPQSVTLNAAAMGGSSINYSWDGGEFLSCTDCQSPVFAPTSPGSYSFTVTVTNESGSSSTCSIRICVRDIRVQGNNDKVYVCHSTARPGGTETLSMSVNAVPAHVPGHPGDHLGRCDLLPCNSRGSAPAMIHHERE